MTNFVVHNLRGIIRSRLLQHSLFWALSFLVLVNVLKVSATLKFIDVVYATIFHACIVLPVYINLFYLIPKLLANKRYFLYLAGLILIILFGIGFYFLMFNHLIDFVLTDYYFIAYYSFFDIALFLLVYLGLTSLLKLARAWFALSELQNENTQNKLQALKAQVNPHFLFNTLSSIYSLARKKSDATPVVIMKLSDTLRYMLYDAEVKEIPVSKEIEIIQNIVDIHRTRVGKNFDIVFDVVNTEVELNIAPLLLIPFVENCFKHVKPDLGKKQFVKIRIEIENDILVFRAVNSINVELIEDKSLMGIGLENVKKRLELIYPNKYKLEVEQLNEVFNVSLNLEL